MTLPVFLLLGSLLLQGDTVPSTVSSNNGTETPSSSQLAAASMKRIIGGNFAPIAAFPWAVSLRGDVHHLQAAAVCGATLISKRWLLSAAHCFYARDPESKQLKDWREPTLWHVTAGQVLVELDYQAGPERFHNNHYHVDKIVIHPLYRPDDLEWDIALMRLKAPLQLRYLKSVFPVSMPSPTEGWRFPPVGDLCVIVGWGCTQFGGPANKLARYALLEVLHNRRCNQIYNHAAGLNTHHEFCAGFSNMQVGICSGDSGGGLVCRNGANGWILAGVTSATHRRSPGDYPAIFTRVAFFSPWIKSVVGQSLVFRRPANNSKYRKSP